MEAKGKRERPDAGRSNARPPQVVDDHHPSRHTVELAQDLSQGAPLEMMQEE
jgi:hypothetical protein